MSDLNKIPLIDFFETTLAQQYTGWLGAVYLNEVPNFTFPSGVTCYMVINPGRSNMQVVEIDSIWSWTVNVSNINVKKGAGVNYTATTHGAQSKVIISDNYQYWDDIRTAINSKLDQNGGNGVTYATEAARDAALGGDWLATKEYRMIKVTSTGLFYNYNISSGVWESIDTWVATPFGTETVAGKFQWATLAQQGTATETGSTGAKLVVMNKNLVKIPTGAGDKNKIPVLDETGKLTSAFIPTIETAHIKDFTLWETIASTNCVSLDTTWNILRTVLDGSVVSDWLDPNFWTKQVRMLSSSSFVTFKENTANWSLQVVVWTISDNVITYWSVNTNTPLSFSVFTWVPYLVVLSSTTFVVVHWYSQFGGGSSNFLQATAYTVSWTTITRWTTITIINSNTSQFVMWVSKVTSSKFIISYALWGAWGAANMVACTVSGTTISPWAPTSVSLVGMWQYISDDKILLMQLDVSWWLPYSTGNVRLYTFIGTSITEWNNMAIGKTYTNSSMKYIWNSKCIFTGTVSTNTEAFIIDASWTTPTKGTTVTVLTTSTSTDCTMAWSDTVCIVTGGNKYYFYTYSGTALTLYNNITKTNSISVNQIDNIGYMKFITPWQVVTNLLHGIIGILKQSWISTESKPVVIQWIIWWFIWLIPWKKYELWTQFIWKTVSPTEIYVSIPYSTL